MSPEKERAIVFQFGEAVRPNIPVGLHFKIPVIQDVKKYDARIQTLDEEPDRILTVESKYLLVDSFIKYRITDVLTFYKANNGSFNSLNALETAGLDLPTVFAISVIEDCKFS